MEQDGLFGLAGGEQTSLIPGRSHGGLPHHAMHAYTSSQPRLSSQSIILYEYIHRGRMMINAESSCQANGVVMVIVIVARVVAVVIVRGAW